MRIMVLVMVSAFFASQAAAWTPPTALGDWVRTAIDQPSDKRKDNCK